MSMQVAFFYLSIYSYKPVMQKELYRDTHVYQIDETQPIRHVVVGPEGIWMILMKGL